MSYEVVQSEHLLKGHGLDVYRDTITLPNGKTTTRENVLRGNAPAIVAVDGEGKLVFVRQYRHAVGEEVLEVPAGMLEEGEDPEVAAVRELEEGTGWIAQKMAYMGQYYMASGFCTEQVAFYIAEDLKEGKANPDPDEFITLESYSLEACMDMIFAGKIQDVKTMAGILAYRAYLQRKAGVLQKR